MTVWNEKDIFAFIYIYIVTWSSSHSRIILELSLIGIAIKTAFSLDAHTHKLEIFIIIFLLTCRKKYRLMFLPRERPKWTHPKYRYKLDPFILKLPFILSFLRSISFASFIICPDIILCYISRRTESHAITSK